MSLTRLLKISGDRLKKKKDLLTPHLEHLLLETEKQEKAATHRLELK